jgi:hypothetical protein
MTMLEPISQTNAVLSRRNLLCLGAAGAIAGVLPTFREKEAFLLAAEDANPTAGQETGGGEAEAIKEFKRHYALEEKECVRHIPPPFLPGRLVYFRKTYPDRVNDTSNGPDAMFLYWQDRDVRLCGYGFGMIDLRIIHQDLADIYPQETEGDEELLKTVIPGDWIVRSGAATKDILVQLQGILNAECNLPVNLSLCEVERKVIVAKGGFRLQPAVSRRVIDVYGKTLCTDKSCSSGDFNTFLRRVGMYVNRRLVSGIADVPKEPLEWHCHERQYTTNTQEYAEDHDPASVFEHLAAQTGLTFEEETRTVPVLFVERVKRN